MERCYDLEDVANNNGILYEIYYIFYFNGLFIYALQIYLDV